jgi:hypothetical protein
MWTRRVSTGSPFPSAQRAALSAQRANIVETLFVVAGCRTSRNPVEGVMRNDEQSRRHVSSSRNRTLSASRRVGYLDRRDRALRRADRTSLSERGLKVDVPVRIVVR